MQQINYFNYFPNSFNKEYISDFEIEYPSYYYRYSLPIPQSIDDTNLSAIAIPKQNSSTYILEPLNTKNFIPYKVEYVHKQYKEDKESIKDKKEKKEKKDKSIKSKSESKKQTQNENQNENEKKRQYIKNKDCNDLLIEMKKEKRRKQNCISASTYRKKQQKFIEELEQKVLKKTGIEINYTIFKNEYKDNLHFDSTDSHNQNDSIKRKYRTKKTSHLQTEEYQIEKEERRKQQNKIAADWTRKRKLAYKKHLEFLLSKKI